MASEMRCCTIGSAGHGLRPGGVDLDQEQPGVSRFVGQRLEVGGEGAFQPLERLAGSVELGGQAGHQHGFDEVERLEEGGELVRVQVVEGLPRHAGPLDDLCDRRVDVALRRHGVGHAHEDPQALVGLDLIAGEAVTTTRQLPSRSVHGTVSHAGVGLAGCAGR